MNAKAELGRRIGGGWLHVHALRWGKARGNGCRLVIVHHGHAKVCGTERCYWLPLKTEKPRA